MFRPFWRHWKIQSYFPYFFTQICPEKIRACFVCFGSIFWYHILSFSNNVLLRMRAKTLHGFKLMQTTNSLPLLSLICWVYFITFIAFCCFIEKNKCKTCVQIENCYTYLRCAYFLPSKRNGGGHDYWFIQGPLDGEEICLMHTATDVYIA